MTKPQPDHEALPISSARLIAYLTVVMGLMTPVIVYFLVLSPQWSTNILWAMLALVLISDYFALTTLKKRFRCPSCQQPFFNRVSEMFVTPVRCSSCQVKCDDKTPPIQR